jgi:hypothetical protein
MKTRNSKLQKTGLTSLTTLTVLVAAVLFLNLQAAANEKSTRLNTGTEAFAEVLASERDAEMNIENWMLNESNFFHPYEPKAAKDARMFTSAIVLETEVEKTLSIAEWMTNESNFITNSSPEAKWEEIPELESWITDAGKFDIANALESETEAALNFEEWMLNEKVFFASSLVETALDNQLEMEAWMLNDSTFKGVSTERTKTESLAMVPIETSESLTTIEYKDTKSGVTFLFRIAETEETEMQLENWMFDKRYWSRKPKTK